MLNFAVAKTLARDGLENSKFEGKRRATDAVVAEGLQLSERQLFLCTASENENNNGMRNKIIRLYYRTKDLSVRRFWENIGRWFSYFNISRRIYDFDYSSILAVERHQIGRVRDSIAQYHNHLYAERDIERLNLALKLLDIIEENGCCKRVGKPFNFVKSRIKENCYELEDDPEYYYTIPVYVNYKNAMRFCNMELSRYADIKMAHYGNHI